MGRKMHDIEFVIDLDPIPKGRPRFGSHGAYTPDKTRKATAEVKFLMQQQYKDFPVQGAIKVEFVFEIRRPKSVSEKKRKYPIVKPDIDNFIKLYCDAMNGIAYVDDTQICTLTASKYYKASGRVLIKIWKMK